MCNYHHPGPRRAWEVGSEAAFLHHFRRSGRLPSRIPQTQFFVTGAVLQHSRGPQIGLGTQWDSHMDSLGPKALQMDPKDVPRRPKGLQRPVKGGPKHPKGSQILYIQTPDQPPKRPLCYYITRSTYDISVYQITRSVYYYIILLDPLIIIL